ncbi:FAD-dependent oxidoreductase [Deinococcus marmoris]|uniref:Membrane protein n=1 Tax=Deinococcus marmoris TaxID=249408 RepID=A0A1U7NVJ0_9DEIO|nr:FAD-dependent oxidoreductase [Deinococcus marmoris]OLV16943.1 membrane protein [Deinococcus marmoris]
MNVDVLVVGGGPAGMMAALAAARGGMSVLLVEKNGYLGGSLTSYGTFPMLTFHGPKGQVIWGYPQELVNELRQGGFSPGHVADGIGYAPSATPFHAEGLKYVSERMLRAAGVQLLYHSLFTEPTLDGTRVTGATLWCREGRVVVNAGVVIDASGDAEVAARAGAGYWLGREEDGLTQPLTTYFRLGNVDLGQVREYMRRHPEEFHAGSDPDAQFLAVSGFFSLWRKYGPANVPRDRLLFFQTSLSAEVAVNTVRIVGANALTSAGLSAAEVEGREQLHALLTFFRAHVPGFEQAELVAAAASVGIRETRRIVGEYTLTVPDILEQRSFDDAVAQVYYPIDVHAPTGQGDDFHKYTFTEPYAIPFRTLVPRGVQGLLVAGRCISVSHEALGSTRVSPISMALGQAAGTAAALALSRGIEVGSVPAAPLRAALNQAGARLPEVRYA